MVGLQQSKNILNFKTTLQINLFDKANEAKLFSLNSVPVVIKRSKSRKSRSRSKPMKSDQFPSWVDKTGRTSENGSLGRDQEQIN